MEQRGKRDAQKRGVASWGKVVDQSSDNTNETDVFNIVKDTASNDEGERGIKYGVDDVMEPPRMTSSTNSEEEIIPKTHLQSSDENQTEFGNIIEDNDSVEADDSIIDNFESSNSDKTLSSHV